MIAKEQVGHYWQYFLLLEQDVVSLSRYVEISKENYKTYSIELVRILLSACAEIDVVAKQLFELPIDNNRVTMSNYKEEINRRYPGMKDFRINLLKQEIYLQPWEDLDSGSSLSWWHGYNKVKHRRTKDHYQYANLENCLNALAALLVLNLYLCQSIRFFNVNQNSLLCIPQEDTPRLFKPDNFNNEFDGSGFIGLKGKLP